MKLSQNAIIAREKLTNYLLVHKKRNDKSAWLTKARYTLDNWEILEIDLRNQILPQNAVETEKTAFGQMFEISGSLIGPNGKALSVITIWMIDRITANTRFITMYPDKSSA